MRKYLFYFMLFSMILLTACSLSVSKDSGEDNDSILPVTKDLPEERKVRDLEMLVTTPDYDTVRYEFGLMVADEWEQLGFDVEVLPTEWNRLSELAIQQKDFDSFNLAFGGNAERIDPNFFIYDTVHSSLAGLGGYNLSGYDNPDYDALAEEQRTITDPDQRKEVVRGAEELFMEDVPYAPVAHRDQVMAYNKENFSNINYMIGEGLNSFWTFMEMEPKGEDAYVRWGYPSDINSLNPLNSANVHDFQVTRLIYDRLVRISKDGEPQNWAAESIEDVNEDGQTYKVTLRPNMRFHDGEPVTAEDVKFSFDLVKEVEAPYFMGAVEPVEAVEVIDDLSVQINLKEPFSPFINNTLGQMYIFPKHFWEPILEEEGANGVLEYKNEEIIGSGPFTIDYWKRDQEMKLDTYENYFSPATIDGILSIPYSSTENMIAAVEHGEADIGGWWIDPIQAKDLEENEEMELIRVPDHGLYFLNYNMRRMPFDDRAVRLAMTQVIPKERIINEILEGYGTAAESLIGPANEFWYSSDIKGYEYDFEAAVKTLKDAGYEWDEEGKIYYPEGKTDQDKEKGIVKELKE